jgi:predicted regulator of Ras-like GTPase activity (Roadblock/LC7/MglB family)
MGNELNLAPFHTLTLEAPNAMIMCMPVGEALLVILAPDSQTLGMIRLQVKKQIPAMAELF